jgi:hypothetical protein
MRQRLILSALAFAAAFLLAGSLGAGEGSSGSPEWSLNATIIEACSCPMFCQCYFNPQPAAHHGHGASTHFCKFNNTFKVNRGNYGSVKLDGVKFWLVGDLGGDFSKGQMDWAMLYFDKSMTKEQRDGVQAILGHLYPVKWNSFMTGEGVVDTWKFDKDSAHAALDGGKTAEVKLRRPAGNANTPDPVVIKNLKYWGAPRNDGFILMPNEVEAYRVGEKAYEFKGTNGFVITFDISSKDVAPAKAGAGY